MNKVNVQIWGRDFELLVSYQNYPGEDVTETQRETLLAIPCVDYDASITGVKSYIRKWFSDELGENSLNNIFRYVMPESFLISRNDNKRVFALMCNFKLDMEHGLCVIFENEEFVQAGPQDLIL